MKRLAYLLGGALLVLAYWGTPAQAAGATQVPVGPRAIALGGAFVSLADDASALFWNPAGLTSVGHQEFSASQADLFRTSVRDNFASFVVPLSPGLAAATDWYHSGFADGSLGFRENRIDAGFAVELRRRLHVGLNAKFLTRSVDLDANNLVSSRGMGLDAGVLYAPFDAWRFGLVAQDALGTHLRDDGGLSSVAYPRALRAAASWNWRQTGLLSAQLDDRWHLGAEVSPLRSVAARLGAQADRHDSEGVTWSCGLGFRTGILRVDWAREFPPTLASTDHFAAAFEFNFNPPQVRIERPRIDELYASLQRSYVDQPIGHVRVRNLKDRPIEATFSVFIPEFMDRPSEQLEVLRPNAVTDVPLRAVLGDRVLALRGDRAVQVQVAAQYASQRLTRRERVSGSTVAYAPGAFDWSRGMAQAAAFVTPRDPAVESLARTAARIALADRAQGFPSRNVALMAAMVDAVATVGVTYVPDPQNPFTAVSGAAHAVDTIYYPAQTLARRTGDCDDSTVLLAALLASVGVPTRFVDAPGHIFLVAASGVDESNAAGLGVDSSMVVTLDHEVWIPIETTAASRGFVEAWHAGAEQTRAITTTERYIDVTEAQSRYEPVAVPFDLAVPVMDEARFSARLNDTRASLHAVRDEYFRARFGGAESDLRASAEAQADIARIHLEGGDVVGARKQLEQALASAPQSAMLHHALAVTLVGQDSLAAAERHFRASLAFAEGTPATLLGLGFVRYLQGDSATALPVLARAVQAAGGLEPAKALLVELEPERRASSLAPLEALLIAAARTTAAPRDGAGTTVLRLPQLPAAARARSGQGPAWYLHLPWWP